MIAVISCVHANLEALRAVLDDIDRQRVTDIICLGDILGYGPDPLACVDLVRERCRVSLLGNHDEAVLFQPDGFSDYAERMIFYHRELLETGPGPAVGRTQRMTFLHGMPRMHAEHGWQFAHCTPGSPLNRTAYPEDAHNPHGMRRIFALIDTICFGGHTHMPGVMTADGPDGPWQWHDMDDAKKGRHRLPAGGQKWLVNVGSVGQPRDGDPRASYALWDSSWLKLRRVPYDVRATVAKVHADPRIPNFLGDRLLEGT